MRIAIEGMHCQGCVQRVRKALEKVEGVRVADVQVGSAEVEASDESEVLDAIRKLGFTAQVSG